MNCPNDNATLVMSERSGIEIDYCPQCRGVWLDRGELDKIIDRSSSVAPAPTPVPQAYSQPKHHDDKYDKKYYDHGHKKHKKEGFLGDLFDF